MITTIPIVSNAASVRVVDLTELNINAGNFVSRAKNAREVQALNEDGKSIIDLWQALPPGEPARCHVPPFGLRFVVSGVIACQASICWRCNNIFGEVDGKPFWYNFDGSSQKARELLKILKRITGVLAIEGTP